MLKAIPGQLVFRRGVILNTPLISYWEAIRRRKQQIIDNNNQNKNKNRKPHIYKVHEKVLVRGKKQTYLRSRTMALI